MTWFGHIDCDKCGHRHPASDDCQKRKMLMAGITPRVVLMDGKPRSLLSIEPGAAVSAKPKGETG